MEARRQRRKRERKEAKLAEQAARVSIAEAKERSGEALALISFACGLASWGWSVVAPNSSVFFGSALLLVAISAMLAAIHKKWSPRKPTSVCIALVAIIGFSVFDWHIVIKPQRGNPFQALLVQGYHLSSECGSLTGKQQMPTWMRDESKGWQAQVEQLISQKLSVKDSQLWQGAMIVGRVTDENTVAYQCTWLANKVGALETIVSTEYNPSLKHRDYNGPIYWFEPANGKVDISDAFKNGNQQANIAIGGGSNTNTKPKQ